MMRGFDFLVAVIGLFGIAALLLSTLGLYAVMAAHVRQRDREIALRLALGATGANVRRLVLVEAGRLAGSGALLGVAGAVAGTRLLRGQRHRRHQHERGECSRQAPG
jgi:ABC-type antimicrobial peptide transport system permease subunit